MISAETIIDFLEIWGTIGLTTAVIFLTVGIDRIDDDARGAYVFRILLIPGIILIWPMVLLRWITLELGSDHPHSRHQPPRNAHLTMWAVLAVIIILVFSLAIFFRSEAPTNFIPTKISSNTVAE